MGWWIAGVIVTVLVLGYIAHKYPVLFGKMVDGGADAVNKFDDNVKNVINKSSNTAG